MAASFHALVGSRLGAFPFLVVRIAHGSESLVASVVVACGGHLLGAVEGVIFCVGCGCVVVEVEGVSVCGGGGGMYGWVYNMLASKWCFQWLSHTFVTAVLSWQMMPWSFVMCVDDCFLGVRQSLRTSE
eukprot:5289678-Amphidinium_carterae.5